MHPVRKRICVVGEGMVEFVRADGGWRLGTGGDALNIAIHLARFGHDVAFGTALGLDGFSEELRLRLRAEAIDAGLALVDPVRQAGLYCVETDDAGERRFAYWRSDSAARQMFALPDSPRLVAGASACDVLIYSLITLAILPPSARETLLACAKAVRARGGLVAFDGNYRPRLWPDATAACAARDAALAECDIGLPTVEDEAMLGNTDAGAVSRAWESKGIQDVVVKLGAAGCRFTDGTIVAPSVVLAPIDTSGAGDAFDAGYLHARFCGASALEAAVIGHRLAGWVVMQVGAAPSVDAAAPYCL